MPPKPLMNAKQRIVVVGLIAVTGGILSIARKFDQSEKTQQVSQGKAEAARAEVKRSAPVRESPPSPSALEANAESVPQPLVTMPPATAETTVASLASLEQEDLLADAPPHELTTLPDNVDLDSMAAHLFDARKKWQTRPTD